MDLEERIKLLEERILAVENRLAITNKYCLKIQSIQSSQSELCLQLESCVQFSQKEIEQQRVKADALNKKTEELCIEMTNEYNSIKDFFTKALKKYNEQEKANFNS